MKRRGSPFAAALAVATLLVPSLVAANPKAIKRVEEMTRIAQEELDLGDAAAAEMRLSEAVAVASSSGLDKHVVTANALLYLSAAYAAQGNKAEAVKSLKSAFAINPALAIPDRLKTPPFNAALSVARGNVAEPVPAPTGGIQHLPLDTTQGGKAVTIEANVGADVKAKTVMLFFRGEKAAAFTSVPMKNAGGAVWRAAIPPAATAGASVAYYIDARNAKAKVVATRGTASRPYVVSVNHPAPPPMAAKPAPKKVVNAKPAAGAGQTGKTKSPSSSELDDENPLLEKKK